MRSQHLRRYLIVIESSEHNTILPIFFSDLDGTLLDHHSYSFAPAQSALNELQRLNLPLVLNTSKTVDEVLTIRRKLNNNHPFVIENGSALLIPSGYFDHLNQKSFGSYRGSDDDLLIHYFGHPYIETCNLLYSLRDELNLEFTGFAEMSDSEVAKATELPLADAAKARQRLSGEPIQWHGDEKSKQDLVKALAEQDRVLVQGGRFLHVMSHVDKALGLRWLMPLYQQKLLGKSKETKPVLTSIALGDSPNDLGMLNASDIAVVIPAEGNRLLKLDRHQQVMYPDAPGPWGWQLAVNTIFNQFDILGVNHG